MNKEKYYTYKLNLNRLTVLAIILFIIVSAIVLLIERNDNYVITYNISIFIYMFLWLILHEILHGIGFNLFKSVNKKNITFGIALEKGVFYCMCKQNIEKKVILTSLLFPVTIIGILTLIIGMVINSYTLVFLSILNITSSIGDIVMTIYFLKTPNNVTYLDLDDCTSFTVISKSDLSKIKVLGITPIKKGIYDKNKMYSKDKKRLTITKPSYIILIIILIVLIISIIGGI